MDIVALQSRGGLEAVGCNIDPHDLLVDDRPWHAVAIEHHFLDRLVLRHRDRVQHMTLPVALLHAAIGQQRPPPSPPIIDDTPARNRVRPCRPGTKLAKVVAALQNPDGATTFQLMCCTGWQPHTIRGALSGMVRKKLGLNVVSTKAAGGERVYRIA